MALFGPLTSLDPSLVADVEAFAARVGPRVGHTPLADDEWRRLATDGSGHLVAAGSRAGEAAGPLTGYAQLVRSPADPAWLAEVLVPPDEAAALADLGAPLLARCLRGAADLGGGDVHLWAAGATPAHAELAARAGLDPYRALHQMERPLPVEERTDLETRGFRPADLDAVVEVNRLAFAHHPAQGDMTRAMFQERMAEPWFDPEGLRIVDLENRVAGFCWTKLFAWETPVLGEIHIICVHPDFAGRQLGRGLVLAGLEHLHATGATVGMLFVEAENDAALELYRKLDFVVVRTDRAFATTVRPAAR
jgi:mycothiol synthase